MNLTEILQPVSIRVPLKSRDKKGVITELVDLLDSNSLVGDRNCALEAVLSREQVRSTGIGSGVAIPHGKSSKAKDLVMAMGIAKKPIDFDSVDKKPVKIVILLLSPADQTGPHIQALATISRLMLDEKFNQSLKDASSAAEVYEMIIRRERE